MTARLFAVAAWIWGGAAVVALVNGNVWSAFILVLTAGALALVGRLHRWIDESNPK